MFIHGTLIPDNRLDKLTDEERIEFEVIQHKLRKDVSLLDKMLLEDELNELIARVYDVPEEDKITRPMSKKERRREASKARKEKRNKMTDESNNNEDVAQPTVTPTEQTFVQKDGSFISLGLFLNIDTDIYSVDKRRKEGKKFITEKKWLIRRDAIRRIAKEAGIYNVTKEKVYDPSFENNYQHGFDVTVHCTIVHEDEDKKETCIHGFSMTTMLGEASDSNTRGISRSYKGLTAERRGYARAVLVHLELSNIYGEDEFITEDELIGVEGEGEVSESIDLKPEEFKEISDHINKITIASTLDELIEVGRSIKSKTTEFNDSQLKLLRRYYEKNIIKFQENI